MEYIAITALGEYQPFLANEFTRLAHTAECNLVDCKIRKISTELFANLLLSGSWNAIAKLEGQLKQLENKFNIHILSKRVSDAISLSDNLAYNVYVIAKESPSMLFQITSFFAELTLPIEDLFSETHPARGTNAMLVSLSMTIRVPVNMQIADLRERFMLFCDRYNFDGMLEIEKQS